jgi:alkyldihydroxyacetonephosphate synthase
VKRAAGRASLPAPLDEGAAARPSRFRLEHAVDPATIDRLRGVCAEIRVDEAARVEAARDWWPISTVWAIDGTAPSLPAVVARPADAGQVAALLRLANEAGVPVTPFAGMSGVCGGAVPLFGGISVDLTGLEGIIDVDDTSLTVDVRCGTFGDRFEEELGSAYDLTLGHWPQSIALSTVGGWVACRGAGQYSTRYGKIEDMVAGLEVALPDGRVIRTGGRAPRTATGPDLTQLFVGSEGTLGVITEARLRVHPRPTHTRRAAFGFDSFEDGLDACRRVLRRGATPGVLRLYDEAESDRNFQLNHVAALVVVDEGDHAIVDTSMSVVNQECRHAQPLDASLAGRWFDHRNQIPPVEDLVRGGLIVDTVEVSGSWRALPSVYRNTIEALRAVEGTILASAHQSHAYTDGACLYFTFAGRPAQAPERYYHRAFEAVMTATTAAGGAISHHHGVGLNRAPYLPAYLGPAFSVLQGLKDVLDPRGILNPGKLGLRSPFGGPPEGWNR